MTDDEIQQIKGIFAELLEEIKRELHEQPARFTTDEELGIYFHNVRQTGEDIREIRETFREIRETFAGLPCRDHEGRISTSERGFENHVDERDREIVRSGVSTGKTALLLSGAGLLGGLAVKAMEWISILIKR